MIDFEQNKARFYKGDLPDCPHGFMPFQFSSKEGHWIASFNTPEGVCCKTIPASHPQGALDQWSNIVRPKQKAATKHDQEKNRLDLLPFEALEEVGKVMTFGAQKYDAHNWRKGFSYSRLIGASMRHIFSFARGENTDPETGLSHLAHAVCCLLFLLSFTITGSGEDDRVKV